MSFLTLADYFGTLVFAISGALAAKKSFDVFGLIVVAFLTAMGGGTLRDLVLGVRPASWIIQPIYFALVLTAVAAGITTNRFYSIRWTQSLIIFDAFGLAVFTIIGTQAAMGLPQVSLPVAVIMGVITGVAGGVLRDIICNDVPLIFQKEIYASARAVGAISYYCMMAAKLPTVISILVSLLITLSVRLIAHWRNWSLPVFQHSS